MKYILFVVFLGIVINLPRITVYDRSDWSGDAYSKSGLVNKKTGIIIWAFKNPTTTAMFNL